MQSYDVFRSENRAGGSTEHVGTIEAIDADNALEMAQAYHECDHVHHLWVDEASNEIGHCLCRWDAELGEWFMSADENDDCTDPTGCKDRTGGTHRPIEPIEEPVTLARLANSFGETCAGFAARLNWPDFAKITD